MNIGEMMKEFLRRSEAMQLLGVGKWKFARLIEDGVVVPRYIGGKGRAVFCRRELERLLSEAELRGS